MLDSRYPQRRFTQFRLRSLFIAIALIAVPLAVVHFCLDRPEWGQIMAGLSGGILVLIAVVALVVAPWVAIIAVAQWWNKQSGAPRFGSLVIKVIILSIVLYLPLVLLLGWLLGDFIAAVGAA
jgi:hypothetical protein